MFDRLVRILSKDNFCYCSGKNYIEQNYLKDKLFTYNIVNFILQENNDYLVIINLLPLLSQICELTKEQKLNIVTKFIDHENIEIRDAVLTCVENWRDSYLLKPLRKHKENFKYFREYIKKVIREIELEQPE